MGNLDDVLKKKIKKLGIERQVEAVGVVEAAQKEIAKFFPEEDFEVVSFKKGVLKIRIKSTISANEINLNKKLLKKSIGAISRIVYVS